MTTSVIITKLSGITNGTYIRVYNEEGVILLHVYPFEMYGNAKWRKILKLPVMFFCVSTTGFRIALLEIHVDTGGKL